MFLGDSQCNENVGCCVGSCDGDFCKNEGFCQPNEDWVKKNCLIPIQSEKEFPKECICGNSDRDSAIINIFIHNDTSDILELIEKKYLKNGNLSLVDCDENSLNCSSIISYKVYSCVNDNESCGRGLLVYPPGSNNTQGKFPDKINPKSVVFIRAYSGEKGGPECHCEFDFRTSLLYRILNDPDSSVQIDTLRHRRSGCSGVTQDKVKHHFDPLSCTSPTDCNSSVKSTGLLSAVGTVVGDATYSVVITGGTSNNNDCSTICPTGLLCYKGQCIPELSCTSSTDCNLDFYCSSKNICIPGCTQTSYNCKPGTTCVNGECTESSNGGNGSNKRLRNILIGVSVVVGVLVIILGFSYFLKNA